MMQIEQKYRKSDANINYRFPGLAQSRDSEGSIQDLDCGPSYDLKLQNEEQPLDYVDQLVELFFVVGRLEKIEIRELLKYNIGLFLVTRKANYLNCS